MISSSRAPDFLRSEGIMTASGSCLGNDTAVLFTGVGWKHPMAALGAVYCRLFHRATVSRPVRGRYHCWKCLREFPVGW